METLFALLVTLGLLSPRQILSPVPLYENAVHIPPLVTKPIVSFGDVIFPASLLIDVKGIETKKTTPSAKLKVPPTPTPTGLPTKKNSYIISFLGDSMVETLGPDFREFQDRLKILFPKTSFTVYNHGVGGKNINDGLSRLVKDYEKDDKLMPSLISQEPDVVFVESFGYNPYSFDEGAMETHWLALAYIIDTIKSQLPDTKVLIMATIAPDSETFGDGIPLIEWDLASKFTKTSIIKNYLENTIKFAESQNLPLVDAYNPSLDAYGNGKDIYINPGDHIHYSDEGRQFVASLSAQALVTHKILE